MSFVSWATPWKPATITIEPSSSAVRRRPGVTSMMRALPCDDVVITPGLRTGVGPGLVSEIVNRHREQRHRDPLARGEQHVQLTTGRQWADLVSEVEQFVGRVAHRGDDHDDVVSGLAGGDDALGDPLDPLGVGNRGTAVFLYDERHGRTSNGNGKCFGCTSACAH